MSLRMKCSVASVKFVCDATGAIGAEEIVLQAVYADNGPNKKWCKWTPCINFSFTISNPDAFGQVKPGAFYYVDLTPTTKDDPV